MSLRTQHFKLCKQLQCLSKFHGFSEHFKSKQGQGKKRYTDTNLLTLHYKFGENNDFYILMSSC